MDEIQRIQGLVAQVERKAEEIWPGDYIATWFDINKRGLAFHSMGCGERRAHGEGPTVDAAFTAIMEALDEQHPRMLAKTLGVEA